VLQGQNLVPNPGFENFTQCPVGVSQLYTVNWYSPTFASPDYFNTCNTSGIVDIPQNYFGWESAKTGVAYCGITSNVNDNFREYIQSQLIDTLITGLNYHVSFYVSLGDSSEYACNNIGAYFSPNAVSASNAWVLPYSPQIANKPLSNPLTNSNGWTLVSDTFTATGGELYITIGNFNNAATSDTVFVGGKLVNQAYYYIDDVSVWTKDSLVGINENEKELFKLFPNPGKGIFELAANATQPYSIEIYNLLGVKVFETTASVSRIEIDITSQPDGIYFLRARTKEGVIEKKVILQK
jgi:hypothetical protein